MEVVEIETNEETDELLEVNVTLTAPEVFAILTAIDFATEDSVEYSEDMLEIWEKLRKFAPEEDVFTLDADMQYQNFEFLEDLDEEEIPNV